MSAMLDVATSLTRSWTKAYTRGLSSEQREGRIAEIESDLWEHQAADDAAGVAPADTGFEMLMRFIFGVPADLLWRRSVAGSLRAARYPLSPMDMKGRSMIKRFMAALGPVLVFVLALFQIANGVGILLAVQEEFVWGLLELGTGVFLLIGLALTRRSPRLGTGIIIATVTVAAGLHFWMPFLAFPVALVIIATMVVRARTPHVTPAVP